MRRTAEAPVDLPYCACEQTGESVRNIGMLSEPHYLNVPLLPAWQAEEEDDGGET